MLLSSWRRPAGLPYLKPDGKLIVNIQQIDPMPVVIGAAEYPQGVLDALKASGANITALDALSMAMDAGSSKAVNVVLMGRVGAAYGSQPGRVGPSTGRNRPPKIFGDEQAGVFLGL